MYENIFKAKVEEIQTQNLYRSLEITTGLEFHHNDYLGLSTHPELLETMASAVSVTGAGSRGSRLLGGNSRLFEDTEDKIARYFGAPAALLFSSGYLANLGIMQVLGECVSTIVSDEKNHASLIDGIRLSKASKLIIAHQKWNEVSLSDTSSAFVAESLYSMDGDLLDKESFTKALEKTRAFGHIDEAHAAGILFEDGRGTPFSIPWERHSKTVTFGKAFGVSGAAILCSAALKDLLINRARSFIYTTALSPIVAVGIQKSLQLAQEESWRREALWARAGRAREILGSYVENSRSFWERRVPILIVPVYGEERALSLARNMREFGFDIRAIRYPTVPKGKELLRITLNLHVSEENTEGMAEYLKVQLERLRNS